jgi:hypothetical protein
MADNFNLRSFLTENKLTKNAQLLNEGFSASEISKLGYEALRQSTDPGIQKLFADLKASTSKDYDECDRSPECRNMMAQSAAFNPQSDRSQAIEAQLIKLAIEKGIDVKQQAPPATPEEEAKALGFWDKIKSKVGLKEEDLDEAKYSDSYDSAASKKVHGQLSRISLKDLDATIAKAEEETGTKVSDLERRVLEKQKHWMNTMDMEMERESVGIDDEEQANDIEQAQHDMERRIDAQVENALQESRLTTKERRLVEMVKKALKEDENVDYTMGRHDDPDQLPNPPAELNIPEGEEMVQDKPLPKYESIEELMKEIEHGTNEAAHKYKMEEMKRVYEALEAKVGSLEEGEHAEHIDQKAVKQMRKDIAALRKAEEKLRKEFEKKFAGKEKKETPAKEKATQALQENRNTMEKQFDLKKFLTENKLTTNSRMVSEIGKSIFGLETEGLGDRIGNAVSGVGAKLAGGNSAILQKMVTTAGIKVGVPIYSKDGKEVYVIKNIDYKTGDATINVTVNNVEDQSKSKYESRVMTDSFKDILNAAPEEAQQLADKEVEQVKRTFAQGDISYQKPA